MKDKKYIVLIFLVAFNLRLGISSIPPVLGDIKTSFALTNFQASLLTSIPVICMGLFAFFVSAVQSKLGRSKGIFILLVLLGMSTIARAVCHDFLALLGTTFFIGATIAIIGPLLSGFIKERFPQKTGLLIGVYSLSMGLGSVSASSVMLPLIEKVGNNWQYALAVWGIVSLIVAFLWVAMVPKEVTVQKIVSQGKKKNNVSVRVIGKMVLFFGIQSGLFYGFITWISEYLMDKGLTIATSILFLTIFTSIQMIGSFVIPALMDQFGTTKMWISFCTIAMLLGALGLLIFGISVLTIGLIGLIAIGASGLFPIAMLLPIRESNNADEASVLMSIVQAFGYILGGLLPMLIGKVIDLTGSYDALLWQLMIGSVILFSIGLSEHQKKNSTDEVRK